MALENVLRPGSFCYLPQVMSASPDGVCQSDNYRETWGACCWLEDRILSNRELNNLFGPLGA